jgi:hypothetical protein
MDPDPVMNGSIPYPRGSSRLSAVCAFSVTAVREVFNEGKFKTPVAVETSHVKWVMHSGELPVPRPGAVSSSDFITRLLHSPSSDRF